MRHVFFVVLTLSVFLPVSFSNAHSQGTFYVMDCVPNTGPCRLLRIAFNGATEVVGTLTTTPCSTPGGTVSVYPTAIEGMAFDSHGHLWAAGDHGTGNGKEYLFSIDPGSGQILSCEEMVLGGTFNVNDIGGMAFWDTSGRLIAVDGGPGEMFVFDPETQALIVKHNAFDSTHGMAKFPDGGDEFYVVLDQNQFNLARCEGGCNDLSDTFTDLGVVNVFIGPSAGLQHFDISGMAAVPPNMLYAINRSRQSLLQIDPSVANGSPCVLTEEFLTVAAPDINAVAFLESDCFHMGTAGERTLAVGGPICMAFNDSCGTYGDNSGGYIVTLTLERGGSIVEGPDNFVVCNAAPCLSDWGGGPGSPQYDVCTPWSAEAGDKLVWSAYGTINRRGNALGAETGPDGDASVQTNGTFLCTEPGNAFGLVAAVSGWTANHASSCQPPSCGQVTGVGSEQSANSPIQLVLDRNPTVRRATVRFNLEEPGTVQVSVFDLNGREIRQLLDSNLGAGEQVISWDGKDVASRTMPAGVYWIVLRADQGSAVRRLTLLQ